MFKRMDERTSCNFDQCDNLNNGVYKHMPFPLTIINTANYLHKFLYVKKQFAYHDLTEMNSYHYLYSVSNCL